MMKSKNNLDEMQEQKLLKIEHTACYIAFWGLLAVIYIQKAMGKGDIVSVGGEGLVLVVMSLYILAGCMKNGIWDRRLKPDIKTNVKLSLATGAFVGVFWFLNSYYRYHVLLSSFLTFVMMFVSVGFITFAILSAAAYIYNRRKRKLDDIAEKEDI